MSYSNLSLNSASTPDYMALALTLAEKGRFSVSPNPMVGCVIVKNNRIVGQGWHEFFGGPHAEINALGQAGSKAKDAAVYITLEPCCHQGKTPPCTSALINAGIKTLYIAVKDPNPLISGKSILRLKSAGINVFVGLCRAQAALLNQTFFYFMQHKKPFVTAKWAMSLDGKTIAHPEDSRQISSKLSIEHLHQTRRQVDAVLIGAQTLISDNPLLTARIKNKSIKNKPIETLRQPMRIILWGKNTLDKTQYLSQKFKNSNLFLTAHLGKILFVAAASADQKINQKFIQLVKRFNLPQLDILTLPQDPEKNLDLPLLLKILGEKNISSVLVEGGRITHEHFFKQNLVNQIQVYLSPVIIGAQTKKLPVKNLRHKILGADSFFIAGI